VVFQVVITSLRANYEKLEEHRLHRLGIAGPQTRFLCPPMGEEGDGAALSTCTIMAIQRVINAYPTTPVDAMRGSTRGG
jgi:hypothetical protein